MLSKAPEVLDSWAKIADYTAVKTTEDLAEVISRAGAQGKQLGLTFHDLNAIIALYTELGKVIPQTLIWEDGRKYSVDRIADIRKAASLKAGGLGLRYTCYIHGKQVYLYKDDDIWFMETED